MLEKAAGYGADALMFDLEDAVPARQKIEARALVRDRVSTLPESIVPYVRVNGWDSGLLQADLEAVVQPRLQGVVVPKVESQESLREVDRLLTELEHDLGIPVGQIDLAVALETARGIWFAYDLLAAAPRIHTVLVGTAEGGDLQADLKCSWTPAGVEFLYARSKVILAARALGIENALDGAYSNFKDEAGLTADSQFARDLGYRGRMVIHPSQIASVNRIFSPTEEEVALSRRILSAYEAANDDERGTTVVDGKMIDYAMARRARALLDSLGASRLSERPIES
jgi:citrate lyase subunit beta / citryl-CoA lyase